MWNSWLAATERSEIEFEQFIETGFRLVDHGPNVGQVIGRDGNYDVEITEDRIHVSFNGKPRYSWYPYVVGYGNLKDEDQDSRAGIGPLEPTELEPEYRSRYIEVNGESNETNDL